MINWGISANSHDAAITVFDGNVPVFASHSERFSKIKNDPDLDRDLIEYALQWGRPETVFWYEKPFKKSLRQLIAGQGFNFAENNVKEYLRQYNIKRPIEYTDHHLSHAAGGYYTSGWSSAAILVIDAIGEFVTASMWHGQGNDIKPVWKMRYPTSVGLFYSAVTQAVGLKPNQDEYILMGMAAYGNPYTFFDYFYNNYIDLDQMKFKANFHKGLRDLQSKIKTEKDKFDIAATAQLFYESVFDELLLDISLETNERRLVFSGGCALNCSANKLALNWFDDVWIMPNPGDAGSSMGCVLAHMGKHIDWPGPYLGYNIVGEYPVDRIIKHLTTDKICAVASGPAEFGPRALGNRSLLADPRSDQIKDRVNEIKQRQKFRPFAPVIMEHLADQFFEMPTERTPYMQFTANCLAPHKYPGIIHHDGTSRVQTVNQKQHPGLYSVLEHMWEKEGCAMLLNTSLNVKDQPMLNDLEDAKLWTNQYGLPVIS